MRARASTRLAAGRLRPRRRVRRRPHGKALDAGENGTHTREGRPSAHTPQHNTRTSTERGAARSAKFFGGVGGLPSAVGLPSPACVGRWARSRGGVGAAVGQCPRGQPQCAPGASFCAKPSQTRPKSLRSHTQSRPLKSIPSSRPRPRLCGAQSATPAAAALQQGVWQPSREVPASSSVHRARVRRRQARSGQAGRRRGHSRWQNREC